MDFFGTELAGFFWKVILTGVFCGLMYMLAMSGINSYKRTNSWTSVIDEIIIGVVVIVGFGLLARMSLTDVVQAISVPVSFIWNLIINFLRQLGFPV